MSNSSGTPLVGRSITLRDLADRCNRLGASTADTYLEGCWRQKTGNQSNQVRISNPADGYDAVEIPCDTSQFFDGNIADLKDPETKETIKVKVEETRSPSDFILWVI